MANRELADLIGTADVDWQNYWAAPAVDRCQLPQPPLDSLAQRDIICNQIGEAQLEVAVLSGAVGAWCDHCSVHGTAGHSAWVDWLNTLSMLELHGQLIVAVEAHVTAVQMYGRYSAAAHRIGNTILPDRPPRHPRTFAARSRHTRWCRGYDLP